MNSAKQRQRAEASWQQVASPIPIPRPQRRWLLIAAGVLAGVLASKATVWLTSPVTPESPATEARCRFTVPPLADLPDLEPRMTASEWQRLDGWIKRNPGAYPRSQATQQPTSMESGPCVS